jgi:hypothetical protein
VQGRAGLEEEVMRVIDVGICCGTCGATAASATKSLRCQTSTSPASAGTVRPQARRLRRRTKSQPIRDEGPQPPQGRRSANGWVTRRMSESGGHDHADGRSRWPQDPFP